MEASLPVLAQVDKRRLLFIGIDGCRSDALAFSEATSIKSLVRKGGAFSFLARTQKLTMSAPCWASILSGYNSSTHGIRTNAEAEKVNRETPKCKGHLFSFLKQSLQRDLNCSAVYCWSGIGGLLQILSDEDADLTKSCKLLPTQNDEVTLTESLRLLTEQPDLDGLFVYLEDVDNAGHEVRSLYPFYFSSREFSSKFSARVWN